MEEKLANRPLTVLQVPCSTKWMSKLAADGFSFKSEESINLHTQKRQENDGLTISNTNADELLTLSTFKPPDWTFSSDYCFTLNKSICNDEDSRHRKFVVGATDLGLSLENVDKISTVSGWEVSRDATTGIDMELLKQTDVPILFYDEFILYQVS